MLSNFLFLKKMEKEINETLSSMGGWLRDVTCRRLTWPTASAGTAGCYYG